MKFTFTLWYFSLPNQKYPDAHAWINTNETREQVELWLKCWTAFVKWASSNSRHSVTFNFRRVPLGKVWNLYIPATVWIVSLVFLNKSGFDIKYPIMVDMPLNKETKPKNKTKTNQINQPTNQPTNQENEILRNYSGPVLTIESYFRPNPFHTNILNIWPKFLNESKLVFSYMQMVSLISIYRKNSFISNHSVKRVNQVKGF